MPGNGIWIELSAAAKMLAEGFNKRCEYFVEKVPVARQSETWVNGPPPAGTAGLKETPTGFPNLPSGYEWIKSADRAMRSGGQNKWQRDQEWLGAKKVLYDAANLFYDPP